MPAASPNTLGEHLRNCRIKRHLFQHQLAKLLQVDRGSIQNWERGVGEPGIQVIPRILDFLRYDPEPLPEALPGRIWYARRRLGFTQEDLAAALKVGSFAVWEWETGRSSPPPAAVEEIQSLLEARRITGVTLR